MGTAQPIASRYWMGSNAVRSRTHGEPSAAFHGIAVNAPFQKAILDMKDLCDNGFYGVNDQTKTVLSRVPKSLICANIPGEIRHTDICILLDYRHGDI
jgi:hypothetical protein